MKIKAIILVFIYVFCGSGLSIDIAKCCDSISGVSLGFSPVAERHEGQMTCCPVLKSVKKERQCCENVVINTVINSVPATSTSQKLLSKPLLNIAAVKHLVVLPKINSNCDSQLAYTEVADQQYPIPILIRKRVLQI